MREMQFSGGDTLLGNTRPHPEHDGKDLNGRWYCTGDGVGEQVAAKLKKNMGLQLSWLERTPDKREVGGSSPLKPIGESL